MLPLIAHVFDVTGELRRGTAKNRKHRVAAWNDLLLGLEMELASARGVSVHYVPLRSTPPVPLWDFKTHRDLFKLGYETMKNEMSRWPRKNQPAMTFLRLFAKKQAS
jgi:hypothetical protein